MTSSKYSPVWPSRSVGKRLVIAWRENIKIEYAVLIIHNYYTDIIILLCLGSLDETIAIK